MPGGNFSPLSLDRLNERLGKLEEKLELVKYAMDKLERQKNEIDDKLQNLEGIRYKVAYMRDIEGKKLSDIAEELGYGIDRIKQISAEISKM
jgi:DNA-directed RNA polymerase specialized sigma24 family protein